MRPNSFIVILQRPDLNWCASLSFTPTESGSAVNRYVAYNRAHAIARLELQLDKPIHS